MSPGTRGEAFPRRTLLTGSAAIALGTALGGCTDRFEPTPNTTPSATASPLPPGGQVSFGNDFQFGVATSAYQVEGAARKAGRGKSIWDTFCAEPGKIADGSSGVEACDHYHLWSHDLNMMRNLQIETYRFSISWSRLMPEGRGRINPRGLTFYKNLIEGLHKRRISPMVTLYHWDLPQWLQDRGGWENRDCASWFGDYAAVVFDKLDGLADVVTINEAKVVAQQGYLLGTMAPGTKDPVATGKVIHHLNLAHGRAVQAFRASKQPGRIGPCLQLTPCYPFDDSAKAKDQTDLADVEENTLYLDPLLKGRYPDRTDELDRDVVRGLRGAQQGGDLKIIAQPVDFVGVSYYTPTVVDQTGKSRMKYPLSPNRRQQLYPKGLYDLLRRVQKDYQVEVKITGNGITDQADQIPPDDELRISYLRDELLAVHQAIEAGAKVSAYYAWSFLDNFAWSQGYTEQWGLIHVNFKTQQRTPKNSARWYSSVIQRHQVPVQ
jgi:beta-glucosidase